MRSGVETKRLGWEARLKRPAVPDDPSCSGEEPILANDEGSVRLDRCPKAQVHDSVGALRDRWPVTTHGLEVVGLDS